MINQIVRDNLINVKGYSPYCGNHKCYEMPRTHFDGSQFYCNNCGWVSSFPVDFIKKYTDKWGI